MTVRTYQAYNIGEALAEAKRDLGVDAVILDTRTLKRGGLFGFGRKTIFELTATDSGRVRLSNQANEGEIVSPTRRGVAAHRAYAQSASQETGASTATAADPETTSERDRIRTRRLAQALVEAHDRRRQSAAESSSTTATTTPTTRDQPSGGALEQPRVRVHGVDDIPSNQGRQAGGTEVAQRYILKAADRASVSRQPVSVSASGTEAPRASRSTVATRTPSLLDRQQRNRIGVDGDAPGPTTESEPVQAELQAIRNMVGQVLEQQARRPDKAIPAMPPRLFDMYLNLLSQDLSEELAERISDAVRDELSVDELDDEHAVRDAVAGRLASLVPIGDSAVALESPDDRPLTIALIGPTGVGKTTTLAKLAASFKLRHGRKVGLVTCDTYRIAAVDQLRTYANIIGLPLRVAITPAEMMQALHSLSHCDVILIDTAGRGQKDSGKLAELKQSLEAAEPHEVHLVLSSTSSEKVLLQEAQAFADVGADKVVLTKLDEAVSFGVLINVMQKIGKELSFITTGQEVPDHLEIGRPQRLAELVLGAELHD